MWFVKRSCVSIFLMLPLVACGVPPVLDLPPPVCEDRQVSTEEEPCIEGPTAPSPTPPGSPTEPPTTPTSCTDIPANVRRTAKFLTSQTTFKSCYKPSDSDTVYVGIKLEDDRVTFVKPLFVFDIVVLNSDGSTRSVASSLLDGYPSSNPDIFQADLTEEDLLAGLEASVAFKFKSSAPEGQYIMAISLFKDRDAFDRANLVGRIFYDFEIKKNP
jgi:hypothetical protein